MRFKKFFTETVNYNVDDFEEKWEKALASSEELRAGIELMTRINKLFPDKEIFVVGGVPRDLIMGGEIDDVDMATNVPFEELAKHFELRNISKNDSQPVYTILFKGFNFDLAKFREDSKTVGRQNNTSTETDSFEADTRRRDLSINSFGLDHTGRIVDYQNGLEDLRNKIVRAVGDPKERFMEDATRILRVFRFAAKMGFDIEESTEKAAIALKHLLLDPAAISVESISKEFYKVAKSGRALGNFLVKLQGTKILHDLIPEFTSMEGFTHNPVHHPEGGSTVLGHILECLQVSPYNDPVINLAVMFHDFGKAVTRGEKNGHSTYYGHEAAGVPIVERIFKRLKFGELSAKDKTAILDAVNNHMLIHKLDELNIKTLTKLVLNPSWEVIKSVGFCDEASRGDNMFNKEQFEAKIQRAEAKVQKIGGTSSDAMRQTVKKYIDGNKILEWFPVVKNNWKAMKELVAATEEFILGELEKGNEPTEEQLKDLIRSLLT